MEIKDYVNTYNRFHFFWETKSPFSQWHPSKFKIQDGTTFNTAEQYMMYTKAITFFDEDIAKKILETNDPREQKQLGRSIKHFNSIIWDKLKIDTVYAGNLLKFTQNENLLKELLDTDGKYLVEASPYDNIWGIGMKEGDAGIENYLNWKGQNLLGNILTNLRTYLLLRNKNSIININKN